MPLGSSHLVRSSLPKVEVSGVWTGGGAAANCTKSSSDHSRGITSVNYDGATGKYTITLSDWGQQLLPGSKVSICRDAAAAPLLVNLVRGSFAVAADGASASVDFEVWDVDGVSALTDLAVTDKALIDLVFAAAAPG
jgi:hypothetical protein